MVDFFFWFWVKDQSLVPALVASIRRWYPESGIVAVADGAVSLDLVIMLRAEGVKVLDGNERMKFPGNCENYLSHGYRYLLEVSQAARFVQVDPDSVIRRRATIPEDDWAGQIFWDTRSNVLSTVGAGAVFSRVLIELLLELLETATPVDPADYLYKDGLISDDAVLGFYLGQLGLKPTPWANEDGWLEVQLIQNYSSLLEDDRWAITHPAAPVKDEIIDAFMELRGGVQMEVAQRLTRSGRPGRRSR